jgi:hypothetical protein
VLEAVFILLEFPSPSRRIFIGSHSLPPLWFAVSVLQKLVESLVDLKLLAEVKMDSPLVKLELLLERGVIESLVKLRFLLEEKMFGPLVNLDLKHVEEKKPPQVGSPMSLLQMIW